LSLVLHLPAAALLRGPRTSSTAGGTSTVL